MKIGRLAKTVTNLLWPTNPQGEIIAKIGDTVTITTIIRPVFNFKVSK